MFRLKKETFTVTLRIVVHGTKFIQEFTVY